MNRTRFLSTSKSHCQKKIEKESCTGQLLRSDFIERILERSKSEILEIGPLNRPLIEGRLVKYFDLMPSDQLKERVKVEGLDPSTVPEINFFHPQGDLSVVDCTFQDIASSHCLEHQPDLIKHLNQVSQLLESEGSRYWAVIPDKRYCFDALLPTSQLSEVIRASAEKHVKPSVWKVIEHRAMTTHNDAIEHWKGNSEIFTNDLKEKWKAAVREFELADGEYVDVHCWQFTPDSFGKLIGDLHELNLINLKVEEIFQTPIDSLEFCVVLKKVSIRP